MVEILYDDAYSLKDEIKIISENLKKTCVNIDSNKKARKPDVEIRYSTVFGRNPLHSRNMHRLYRSLGHLGVYWLISELGKHYKSIML